METIAKSEIIQNFAFLSIPSVVIIIISLVATLFVSEKRAAHDLNTDESVLRVKNTLYYVVANFIFARLLFTNIGVYGMLATLISGINEISGNEIDNFANYLVNSSSISVFISMFLVSMMFFLRHSYPNSGTTIPDTKSRNGNQQD